MIKKQDGIAVIEAVIALSLIAASGVYFLKAVGISNNISSYSRHRFKAQIITESVGYAITSLTNRELHELITIEQDTNSNSLKDGFDSSSQPWLNDWNQHDPEVQEILFKVEIFDGNGNEILLVPALYQFEEYDKKISVEIKYLSNSKTSRRKNRERTIKWNKWVIGK